MFYDRLQSVLIEGGFAEATCKPYYATSLGAPSLQPGRYFRIHLVGYFEGINFEYGLEWRCSGSLSLREFLRLEQLARESGIETATAEDLARLDRKRKGRQLPNRDWVSRSGPEARIARMKDVWPISPTSSSTRWIWTQARWWQPSCTQPMSGPGVDTSNDVTPRRNFRD